MQPLGLSTSGRKWNVTDLYEGDVKTEGINGNNPPRPQGGALDTTVTNTSNGSEVRKRATPPRG